MRLVKK